MVVTCFTNCGADQPVCEAQWGHCPHQSLISQLSPTPGVEITRRPESTGRLVLLISVADCGSLLLRYAYVLRRRPITAATATRARRPAAATMGTGSAVRPMPVTGSVAGAISVVLRCRGLGGAGRWLPTATAQDGLAPLWSSSHPIGPGSGAPPKQDSVRASGTRFTHQAWRPRSAP